MMFMPSFGLIGWVALVPPDWPFGSGDPQYAREKQLVDYLAADISGLIKRAGLHRGSTDSAIINFEQRN